MDQKIASKIDALQAGSASAEEFMKNLAQLDENGQLSDEIMQHINGGTDLIRMSDVFLPPTMGMFPNPPSGDRYQG